MTLPPFTLAGPSASAAAALPGLPVISSAFEPQLIRDGNAAAKRAYQIGLGFEEMLVDQLAQELAATISPSADGGGAAGDAGADASASGGLAASDPAGGAYAGLIPEALGQSVISAGGVGVALQIAAGIDPALASSTARPGR